MKKQDVVKLIQKEIKLCGSQMNAAIKLGLTQTEIHNAKNGRFSKKLLAALNLEVNYVRR